MNRKWSLVNKLQELSSNLPDKIAYTLLGNGAAQLKNITYRQLDVQAMNIAAFLRSRTNPGERALLIYPQSLEFIIAFLAACMQKL